MNVLVTYATKHGSTAEIAQRIGDRLENAGLPTTVLPVEQATGVSGYGAVVLGSAVYIGRWRKEAVDFLEDNTTALAQRNVWIFSSGPTGEGDPVELLQGWHYPEKLQESIEFIQPEEIVVFHGELDESELGRLEKWTIKRVKAPVGDFRDWDAIDAWADSVAAKLISEKEAVV